MAAQAAGSAPAPTSVGRCIESIRQLILTGELLPGETIRQARLAEQLGTSRIPVREALTTLQAEGVVTYTPRIGHAVARFNPAEFAQIYLMRRLLETELLATVELPRVDVSRLTSLNDQLEQLDTAAPGPLPERRAGCGSASGSTTSFTSTCSGCPRTGSSGPRSSGCGTCRSSTARCTPTSPTRSSASSPSTARSSRPSSPAAGARVLDELDRHRGGAEAVVLRRLGPLTAGGS